MLRGLAAFPCSLHIEGVSRRLEVCDSGQTSILGICRVGRLNAGLCV